jgi:hypothetical protein
VKYNFDDVSEKYPERERSSNRERTNHPVIHYCVIAFVFILIGAGGGAIATRAHYERELDGRDQLVERYGNAFNEAAGRNRSLAERAERVERGLTEIAELAGSAVTNLRGAVEIITKVRDRLKEMEDDGALGYTDSAGGGDSGGDILGSGAVTD